MKRPTEQQQQQKQKYRQQVISAPPQRYPSVPKVPQPPQQLLQPQQPQQQIPLDPQLQLQQQLQQQQLLLQLQMLQQQQLQHQYQYPPIQSRTMAPMYPQLTGAEFESMSRDGDVIYFKNRLNLSPFYVHHKFYDTQWRVEPEVQQKQIQLLMQKYQLQQQIDQLKAQQLTPQSEQQRQQQQQQQQQLVVLHQKVSNEHQEMVKTQPVTEYGTALHWVIKGGNAGCVAEILRLKPDLTAEGKFYENSHNFGLSQPQQSQKPRQFHAKLHSPYIEPPPKQLLGTFALGKSVEFTPYEIALHIGKSDIISMLRKYGTENDWSKIRLLILANRSKGSVVSRIPSEVVSIIHERIFALPSPVIVPQQQPYYSPYY